LIFKKQQQTKQKNTTTTTMKLLAAQCGQNLFEIAFEFIWLRMFVLRKKILQEW